MTRLCVNSGYPRVDSGTRLSNGDDVDWPFNDAGEATVIRRQHRAAARRRFVPDATCSSSTCWRQRLTMRRPRLTVRTCMRQPVRTTAIPANFKSVR